MNKKENEQELPVLGVQDFLDILSDESFLDQLGVELVPIESESISFNEHETYSTTLKTPFTNTPESISLSVGDTPSEVLAA